MGPMIKHISKTQQLWDWIASNNLKHQSPIVQIFARPFSKPWVIIADFREAQDILLRRSKEFDRGALAYDIFGGILPESHVWMRSNETFKRSRKWMQDLMAPAFLLGVAGPQIYTAMSELMDLWEEKARLAQGHPFEASGDLYHAALDAVGARSLESILQIAVPQRSCHFVD